MRESEGPRARRPAANPLGSTNFIKESLANAGLVTRAMKTLKNFLMEMKKRSRIVLRKNILFINLLKIIASLKSHASYHLKVPSSHEYNSIHARYMKNICTWDFQNLFSKYKHVQRIHRLLAAFSKTQELSL